jgi:diadenosine tetraphosphate (Ap4A) HIT family hydrolase
MGECFICAKHRAIDSLPGGALLADDHAVVSHLPLETPEGSAESVYLGYLFVEPRRHVLELGALDADEAASVGRLVARASSALQTSEGAEHVYLAVIGHGVKHLHVHLLPRYPGTPPQFWWTRVDEWPGAPRGGASEVAALAERLRSALAASP